MSSINCLYCHRMLFQYYGSPRKRKCDDCNVEYQLNDDKQVAWIFLNTTHDEFGILAAIDLEEKRFQIIAPGIEFKILVQLSFIPPNITPQNIKDKVKLYLTFS